MNKIVLFFISLLISCPAWATAPERIADVKLLSEISSIGPSQPFRLAVVITPKAAGWHTYWENPGDAGLATTLEWTLPEGFSASGIDWPVPLRMQEGPLVVYGYDGEVFLPVTLTPPAALKGDVTLKVKTDYLICKDICIPESAEMEITLPAGVVSPSSDTAKFAAHDESRPDALKEPPRLTADTTHIFLSVPLTAMNIADAGDAYFFARQFNRVKYSGQQVAATADGALHLAIEKADNAEDGDVSGLLEVRTAEGKTFFDIPLIPSPQGGEAGRGAPHDNIPDTRPLPNSPPLGEGISFLPTLLFAILGGLILNLMPCVLPVLSLKALAIAKKAGSAHGHVVRDALAYTLGVLVSFGVIAGILIGLQQAGDAVGWGYQMQSPAFVGFLIYLLFLIGLNLSGVFHLPVLLGSVGRGITGEASPRGSFVTGVLATAVATPCTAPFMASAVGVALTLPAWQAMLVFEALGLGLALPFLLIAIFPKLLRFLPRPGAWMETFRQFLAFPMYASAIWLLWVLTLQTGAGGMAVALCGMLLIVAVLWMKALYHDNAHWRLAALIALACVIGLSLPMLSRMEIPPSMPAGEMTEDVNIIPYTKQTLEALRADGKPVFVDATAAWCITCQVNARTAIHTENTMQAFRDGGIVLVIADWTRRNEEITEFLRGFGYNGVPLYVFYPAGGEPVVLPQLLTETIVINAIK